MRVGPRALQRVVALLAVNFWAPKGYWIQMKTLLTPTADDNYSEEDGRKQLAQRGMMYMVQNPIFGVGLSNFSKSECAYTVSAAGRASVKDLRCAAPHNSFVQAFSELGIPWLVLWSPLSLGGIVSPLVARRRMPRRWRGSLDAEERFLYAAAGLFPVCMMGLASAAFFLSFAFLDVTFLWFAFGAGFHVAVRVKLSRIRSWLVATHRSLSVSEGLCASFVADMMAGSALSRRCCGLSICGAGH